MSHTRDPLRFRISSWRQLTGCRSNNDPDFRIHVTDFYNNRTLRGFRIRVDHPAFGDVFCCVLHARGTAVTDVDEYGRSELSESCILAELAKFGFFIEYAHEENLSGRQIQYLMTLKQLDYDKIRIINVWSAPNGAKQWAPKVVAFQSRRLGNWLNNAYSPSEREFTAALVDGVAINLTDISKTKQFRWDWLKEFVGNIDDILADNADDMIRVDDPNEEG